MTIILIIADAFATNKSFEAGDLYLATFALDIILIIKLF